MPLVVDTPKHGRKVFTGETHMPTPTKILWFTNVNLLNNAKHAYDMLFNVNPKIDMIVSQDIEMTSPCEYADPLAANSWLEFEDLEVTASCSNPFLQVWKGGIKPVYDTKDDMTIMAGVAAALAEETGDERFRDHWAFEFEGKRDVYLKRLLGGAATTADYDYDTLMEGGYGEPGVALMMFRTYPRIPFFEQIHDHVPLFTDMGRLNAYCDIPEAIEYGENFIVHREGARGHAVPAERDRQHESADPSRGLRHPARRDGLGRAHGPQREDGVEEVKATSNPLVEQGFYLMTSKQRHSTHSQWAVTDWHFLWSSDFDPHRTDTRQAGVAEHQMHMNPEAAKDLDLHEGDYVHVDANPADRPYRGWKPDDWFYKVSRLMVRVKFNPAYPYDVVMIKHAPHLDREVGARTRVAARRSSGLRGHRLPGLVPLRVAPVPDPRLVDADAPDRQPVPQVQGRAALRLRLRGGQPRREHRAEGDARPGRVRRGRRTARTRRLEAGHDRALARAREPRDGGLPARPLRPAGGPMSPLRDPTPRPDGDRRRGARPADRPAGASTTWRGRSSRSTRSWAGRPSVSWTRSDGRFYGGAHDAYEALGEARIRRLIAETYGLEEGWADA